MKALIVVDYQHSFASPDGSLYVQGGETIKDALEKRVQYYLANDLPVILTRDWHPKNHCSFKSNGGQWPDHCVKHTKGAKYFVEDWGPFHKVNKDIYHLMKAYEGDKDSYSAFGGKIYSIVKFPTANHMKSFIPDNECVSRYYYFCNLESFAEFLHFISVDELEVCGLALDYCVKSTAIDGILNGFKVNVNVPLTKSVFPDNDIVTLKTLKDAGVGFNI